MGIMCDICKKEIKRDSSDHIKISIEGLREKTPEVSSENSEDDFANVPGVEIKKRFDLHSECYKDKIEKEWIK